MVSEYCIETSFHLCDAVFSHPNWLEMLFLGGACNTQQLLDEAKQSCSEVYRPVSDPSGNMNKDDLLFAVFNFVQHGAQF